MEFNSYVIRFENGKYHGGGSRYWGEGVELQHAKLYSVKGTAVSVSNSLKKYAARWRNIELVTTIKTVRITLDEQTN